MSEYLSPLISKLSTQEPLTLETLKKYVPVMRAGEKAATQLTQPLESEDQRRMLRQQVREGKEATEKLVMVCMPLVKSLVSREYQRRKSWSSRVRFDDMFSEGMAGLMRGLKAYDPDGGHTSPTNYIGQWISTEIRRNTENLDHDLAVPYEAIERQRKIRAVRSRLWSELGREPTDEEIVAAANDKTWNKGSMMGQVNKTAAAGRRIITVKHVQEERDMHYKTGTLLPYHTAGETREEGETRTSDIGAVSILNPYEQSGVDALVEEEGNKALGELIESSFDALIVGHTQREVIRRRFGIPPYDSEQKIHEIVTHTGVTKHKVNKVINAYTKQMTIKGGKFHFLVSQISDDHLESMGIGWVKKTLGDYVPGTVVPPVPSDLTAPLGESDSPRFVRKILDGELSSDSGVVRAVFSCDRHQHFTGIYASEHEVPAARRCPQCLRDAPRLLS